MDGIAYFARALNYDRKMFMKLMIGGRARNGTLRFFCVKNFFSKRKKEKVFENICQEYATKL